ncbi:MAG: hypothetical protein RMX96_29155 [Nostoc sp. ChiSLP02]|nr:hypothetical protein [Nostoc sp. DedSLP05]MDZ8100704.1 hypothetical protein [Nostoc sp. DedSLP01]MDZ8188909.1 hypothetical protein [Nostoc sp. ChiSLP02]
MQNYSTSRVQDSTIPVQQIGEQWALWNWVMVLSNVKETLLQQFLIKNTTH